MLIKINKNELKATINTKLQVKQCKYTILQLKQCKSTILHMYRKVNLRLNIYNINVRYDNRNKSSEILK